MNSQRVQEIEIVVERGYHPQRATLTAGVPVRLTFLRRESGGCSREIVIPKFGIRKELPQNVPVTIQLPPLAAGELAFTCGMNMMRGALVVATE
jgi:plastocyanin domain-containing protein